LGHLPAAAQLERLGIKAVFQGSLHQRHRREAMVSIMDCKNRHAVAANRRGKTVQFYAAEQLISGRDP
jgi:hypothetical protein